MLKEEYLECGDVALGSGLGRIRSRSSSVFFLFGFMVLIKNSLLDETGRIKTELAQLGHFFKTLNRTISRKVKRITKKRNEKQQQIIIIIIIFFFNV